MIRLRKALTTQLHFHLYASDWEILTLSGRMAAILSNNKAMLRPGPWKATMKTVLNTVNGQIRELALCKMAQLRDILNQLIVL